MNISMDDALTLVEHLHDQFREILVAVVVRRWEILLGSYWCEHQLVQVLNDLFDVHLTVVDFDKALLQKCLSFLELLDIQENLRAGTVGDFAVFQFVHGESHHLLVGHLREEEGVLV